VSVKKNPKLVKMKICVPNGFGEYREDDYAIDSSDDELLDKNNNGSPTGSVLSANAEPFLPSYYYVNDDNVVVDNEYVYIEENGIAIYNDGVPCLSMISEKDRRGILNGINDDVFVDSGNGDDSAFPLDANDAAELEAMDAFVMEMANLALLEEREEQARLSFSHVKKRWEVRRQQGPSHRGPHPCMNLIVPTNHSIHSGSKTPPNNTNSGMSSLIAYSHALRVHEERMRAKEILATTTVSSSRRASNTIKNNGKHIRRPIQQPRKDS
jgi:hypothetical protein